MKCRILYSLVIMAACSLCFSITKVVKPNDKISIGQPIDSLHGVKVYYNGPMDNVSEVNITADNYNLGLKYQCVEFAKRYYYQHYNHKMPEIFGNAKDFYDKNITDGGRNTQRDLIQFANPSIQKPQVSDLLVYDATKENPYGHVAIISKVGRSEIEIIQQNPGPGVSTREHYLIARENGKWRIQDPRIMGWLRKE